MSDHYYSPKPTSSIVESQFTQTVRGVECTFITASGLFSQKHVDTGSILLIESAVIEKGNKILDLGCGYGPVGIYLKKVEPSLRITFSDVNTRAVQYVKRNLQKNSIEPTDQSIEIVSGNGYASVNGLFDVILLNPPQSAGKQLCFDLISRAKEFLNPSGSLQIVARRNKGGETLSQHMRDVFGNVEPVSKMSGFWVYRSVKQ